MLSDTRIKMQMLFCVFILDFFVEEILKKNGKYSNIIKCYKKIKKGVYGLFN